jgi:hypothetical protein
MSHVLPTRNNLIVIFLVATFGLVSIVPATILQCIPRFTLAWYRDDGVHNKGSFGFYTEGTAIRGVKEKESPAYKAGLRDGDCLEHAETIQERLEHYRTHLANEPFQINLADGPVVVTTVPAPFSSSFKFTIVLRCLTYLIFLFVGIRFFYSRPGPMSWALFFYCAFSGAPTSWLWYGGAYLPTATWWLLNSFWRAAGFAGNFGFLIFALRFPDDDATGWRHAVERRCWIAIPLYFLLWFVAWPLQSLGYVRLNELLLPVSAGISLLSVWVLVDRYRNVEGLDRRKLAWVILALCAGNIVLLVRDVAQNWQGGYILHQTTHGDILSRILGIATVIVPLAVIYAAKARVLADVTAFVSPAVISFVGSFFLVALASSIDEFNKHLLGSTGLSVIVTVVTVAVLTPIGDLLKKWSTSNGGSQTLSADLGELSDELTFIKDLRSLRDHATGRFKNILSCADVTFALRKGDQFRAGSSSEAALSDNSPSVVRLNSVKFFIKCSEEDSTIPAFLPAAKYAFPVRFEAKLLGILFIGESPVLGDLKESTAAAILDVCRTFALVTLLIELSLRTQEPSVE